MSQKGVALLMVLWVLAVLMVIVFSFSFMTRTEISSTLSFKEGIERKFLAEAGIERGIMELFYRNNNKDMQVELEGSEVWKTDATPYTSAFGDGSYTVRIMDESGKVDINESSDVVLKNLFVNLGVGAEDADALVDCIMDWKDPDDLHRLHGAESDYYMSLPNPYNAKNAPFDTLEELLLVKGMTPEILYGTGEKKGAIDFLTVNSKSNTININAAPKEVLMAIPQMTPELADAIIDFRQNSELDNSAEIQNLLGENYNIMARYINTGGVTDTFTIESSGSKGAGKGTYSIRATVSLSGDQDQKYTYLYYKSPVYIK